MFLIYINDLPDVCTYIKPFLFADDTNLLCSHDINIATVQEELNSVFEWLSTNKLSLNVSKTARVSFATKDTQPLYIAGNEIANETKCKYLGIFLDSDISFKPHIDYLCKKLAKHVNTLARARHYIPKHVLYRYYDVYMKPVITYGILVYGATRYNFLKKILLLQKKAIRLINFLKRNASTHEIFFEKRILTVHELFVYELLKFVVMAKRNDLPENKFHEYFQTTACYDTRRTQKGLLRNLKNRSKFMEQSIISKGIKLYNYLITIDYLPKDLNDLKSNSVKSFYHSSINVIIQNEALINTIY